MRRVVAALVSAIALGCWETPPATPQASIPSAGDLSCGAIVEGASGRLHNRVLTELEKLLGLLQSAYAGPQPQIIVWRPGKWAADGGLRVRFLDGDAALRTFVMTVAKEWETGINLTLGASTDVDAEIRVTFTGTGLWSKIGRTARLVSGSQPTMGLGGLVGTTDQQLRRAYILHEFGHALGALHEHQRPDAPLTWNRSVVYEHYQRLYQWTTAQVDAEVILPLQYKKGSTASSAFDPASVMMYAIHKNFTKEGFVQPWNSQITQLDRAVMADLYR